MSISQPDNLNQYPQFSASRCQWRRLCGALVFLLAAPAAPFFVFSGACGAFCLLAAPAALFFWLAAPAAPLGFRACGAW